MRDVADITVTRRADGDPMGFDVSVHEGDSTTDHEVTLTTSDLERLGGGRSPEAFVRDCFAFLLEREPKESILRTFDVNVIGGFPRVRTRDRRSLAVRAQPSAASARRA
jgi:hypothetical protein